MAIRLGGVWHSQNSAPMQPTVSPLDDRRGEQWQEVATPANAEHFQRLLTFTNVVLAVCERLGVSPTLSGSLAVLAYTQQPTIMVDDVDLACSEREFSRLSEALTHQGTHCQITTWHVLQARQDGMKVEFDSTEYWMAGLSGRYRRLDTGRNVVRVVDLDDLRELYRRGIQDLEAKFDEASQTKLRHMQSRYELLARPGRGPEGVTEAGQQKCGTDA